MKRTTLLCVAFGLAVLWTAGARAAEGLWDTDEGDGAKKTTEEGKAPAAENPAIDFEAVLPPTQYQRAIKPILVQVEQAEKLLGLHKKEMAKVERRRNLKKAVGFKEKAARAYLTASLKAKQAQNLLPKPELREGVMDQYYRPTRQKAVDLYLELADTHRQKRDVRAAHAYYKKILAIDRDNKTAKQAIKEIEKAAKDRITAGKSTGQGGGSGENERAWGDDDKDWGEEGRDDVEKDSTKTGREAEDWKKGGY